MSRPDLDADAAVKALTFRLRDWGVTDPAIKARAFIDDLQGRGWKVSTELPTRRPVKAHEQCPSHDGQHRDNCGGCAADRKAAREEQAAADDAHRLTSQAEAIQQARAAIKASRAAHLTAEEAS